VHEATHEIVRSVEVDHLVVAGTPGQSESRMRPLLDQDLDGRAEICGVAVVLDELLMVLKDLEPPPLLLFRNLV
jgi:hypothetical protein